MACDRWLYRQAVLNFAERFLSGLDYSLRMQFLPLLSNLGNFGLHHPICILCHISPLRVIFPCLVKLLQSLDELTSLALPGRWRKIGSYQQHCKSSCNWLWGLRISALAGVTRGWRFVATACPRSKQRMPKWIKIAIQKRWFIGGLMLATFLRVFKQASNITSQ